MEYTQIEKIKIQIDAKIKAGEERYTFAQRFFHRDLDLRLGNEKIVRFSILNTSHNVGGISFSQLYTLIHQL